MNIQPKNYSIEDESKMVKLYTDNPTRETVQNLAGELGKSAKSITAKLSQLGVYKKIERATKTGKPVISKGDLVKIINEHFYMKRHKLVIPLFCQRSKNI